ncbi:MAG: TlpA family protein disulfide reductase, partial [Candidatus Methylomirabilia bacterium]
MAGDEIEVWFEKGVTDGLPVVPPNRERVERMLGGTCRDRREVVGLIPPNYGRATIEKIAINAVMAGCKPAYLPVVIGAVEAACDPVFNLHGHSA